ncbi:polysaccharide biosynthesis/export family protein [Mucilaginibacter gotjawali]|uniref:Polysaccharide biosynthesis/export protein n=2 Tax=Mucilaginibacter gotjawali TaxID=1550579 RepID=A0A0X8X483_9SPHI|nr:polysaccharide biosynthesis/export family protein [Mucilaginibacter gotjawali]MBB3057479.1 polysaccharide export outer membrane protein [Mucilaginibacter gotjawali]BAU55402.1 Polysaccharide biosynthesis/export protein [Mucilaginibacter gotjawali]
MNYKQRQRIQIFLLILASIALFSSCTDYNKILYLKDIPDSLQTRTTQLAKYKDPVIQSDDILSIIILTIDPQTAAIINQGQAAPQGALPGASVSMQQINGYLVDKNGNVSLPIIGQVKIAGLTTTEARQLISNKVAEFYKDPNVQVRFANFKVTVLGEVARPSTYILPNEKNTVLDALGLAGDITIYGKKDNVLLIRDSLNSKVYVRLNLNSSKTLQSPYFYLRQNDVIYVEPTKSKLVASDATQTKLFTIGVSVLTAIALILIRFK